MKRPIKTLRVIVSLSVTAAIFAVPMSASTGFGVNRLDMSPCDKDRARATIKPTTDFGKPEKFETN